MSNFRFQFKRYKSPSDRLTCPGCDHKRTFTPYIDTTTGELLPHQYGKCERVNNCGYELSPYKDGYFKAIQKQERANLPNDWKPLPILVRPTPQPTKPIFIPNTVKETSLKAYGQNNFVKYLHTLFDASDVKQVTERYQVGTSSRWPGATVFWYVDIDGNVRAGQVKHFDQTGHTVKDVLPDGETQSRTTWIHSILKREKTTPIWLSDYLNQNTIVSCLFGEHLLRLEPDRIVCLVEAPKTAVIASLYFPQYVWLAVGALTYLTADRCKSLEGRKVILWPDLKALEKWQKKADELSAGRWIVSDFLEKTATDEERNKGLDLADYLTDCHYQDFILGYPRSWKNDRASVGYVPKLVEHTPQTLQLTEAITPPVTEADLIEWWSNKE